MGPLTSEQRAAFNERAKRGAGPRMEEAHEYAGKNVLDRIELGYDESFIDLGCGNGWAVRHIAQKVPTIGLCVGVDVSDELIQEARRLSAGKFPVKFLVAPIEDVPMGEASFDHAFSMEAFYYVRDPLAALQAVHRLLKPGGRFHLVIDFYKENPASAAWQKDVGFPMHFLSQAEWTELYRQAGFTEVHAERILDDRPAPDGMSFPWGGFSNREELERFRREIGSLYIRGRKAELSHALDPYLERAREDLEREGKTAQAQAPTPTEEPRKKMKRRSLFAGRDRP